MKTNMWDFACKHPIIFMLGLTSIAATVGNVIISVIDNNEEKENNHGVQTDNVQSSSSM